MSAANASLEAMTATHDAAPDTTAPAANDTPHHGPNVADQRQAQPARSEQHHKRMLDDLPEHLLRALGPVPEERITRERWQREAQRLEALRIHGNAKQRPAPSPTPMSSSATANRQRATPSPPPQTRRDGPTITR